VEPFAGRLSAAVAAHGPLCAGIDPSPEALGAFGLADTVDGLRSFASICLEACVDTVAIIKPQVAFFERFGSAGFSVLEDLCRQADDTGVLLIADAKRGDISTTAAAYAAAWVGASAPFSCDALTVTPYLGLAALSPITTSATTSGRGVFVVVASSNPEGRSIQEARGDQGTVEAMLFAEIGSMNAEDARASIGAVIGASRSVDRAILAAMAGPILVPGFGAQGGDAADISTNFSGLTQPVVVAASRSWLSAGPSVGGLRDRAQQLNQELRAALA
jgi:orotidine-5'-phosphate decarboxylase